MLRSVLFLFVSLFIFAGCGPLQPNRDAPADLALTPTIEAVPTFTLTPEPVSAATAAQETAASTSTPTSAATAEDSASDAGGNVVLLLPTTTPVPALPQLSVVADSVNVRNGPGIEYEAIDVVVKDESFSVTGRNESGDWWQACCFADQKGWLYGPLVEVQNAESIALAADIPPTPVATPTSVSVAQETAPQEPDSQEPVSQEPVPQEQNADSVTPVTVSDPTTLGDFNPDAQYHIVHYRVLGFDDNNGGIFNKGGQQLIFVTVLDQNGNGVDGAVIKDAVGDKLNVSVGNKGPGKAEIKMDWDPYKLYVAADPSGAVTSQVSNQMNNPYPHIPDVVGMLGPVDNEYAICPTVDDRCDPPFYHAHWSYEIIFQKVK